MRGVGWAVTYLDPRPGRLSNHWITLHEDGNIAGFKPIVVMDVWEHAFLLDYKPADRPKYIESFLANFDVSRRRGSSHRGPSARSAESSVSSERSAPQAGVEGVEVAIVVEGDGDPAASAAPLELDGSPTRSSIPRRSASSSALRPRGARRRHGAPAIVPVRVCDRFLGVAHGRPRTQADGPSTPAGGTGQREQGSGMSGADRPPRHRTLNRGGKSEQPDGVRRPLDGSVPGGERSPRGRAEGVGKP